MCPVASWVGGSSREDPLEAARETAAKANPTLHHCGNPEGKTVWEFRSRDAFVKGMLLGLIFCKRNKVLNSEVFLKPWENPTLITDDSLTFFQLLRSSRQVKLLGRAQAGMLGYVWILTCLPPPWLLVALKKKQEKEPYNPGSCYVHVGLCHLL